MYITPISNKLTTGNNLNFTAKKKENYKTDNNISSNLKKVPVMVLIAMSPINPINAQTVQTDRNEIAKEIYEGKMHSIFYKSIDADNETMTITGLNRQKTGKPEYLQFHYRTTDYMNNKSQKVMDGIIKNICPEKDSDGRYIITYHQQIGKKFDNERICTIPEEFGKYILEFANSNKNNNAVKVLSKDEMYEKYGISNIEGAAPIDMHCTTYEISSEEVDKILQAKLYD